MPPSTSAGWLTAASGTNTVPPSNRPCSRSPAASARRVLPIPPGPVSVTSRTPGCVSRPVTCSMSSSRPTSDVTLTGSARGPRRIAGDPATEAPAAANRSLSSAARSSRTSRPSSADVRK